MNEKIENLSKELKEALGKITTIASDESELIQKYKDELNITLSKISKSENAQQPPSINVPDPLKYIYKDNQFKITELTPYERATSATIDDLNTS